MIHSKTIRLKSLTRLATSVNVSTYRAERNREKLSFLFTTNDKLCYYDVKTDSEALRPAYTGNFCRAFQCNFCRARARNENCKCKLAAILSTRYRSGFEHARNLCDIAATKSLLVYICVFSLRARARQSCN